MAAGKHQPSFGIHPGDDALVGEAVIAVILHADDQVFVNLDADNFSRPDDFLVMAISSGEGSRSLEGWLWARIIAAALAKMRASALHEDGLERMTGHPRRRYSARSSRSWH
jgi:hypothetical protein